MNAEVAVTLPGGFWLDGICNREAVLRPLSGVDEAFLCEEASTLLPADRTTALLARCLESLGPVTSVTPESVRALTVGDRETLLLHLRRLTLGDAMPCVLDCPACREKMDLDLKVSDLLLPPYSHAQEWYEKTVTENGTAYRIRFRLPTGADQEAAAALAFEDPEAAANLVLQQCVKEVADNVDLPLNPLPPAVARALPQLMADLDPQAELLLDLTCPACNGSFSVLFDTADYLMRELAAERRDDLYREVHLLAFYYHWSEAEIMALTRQRRLLYLSLLSEALGERSRG